MDAQRPEQIDERASAAPIRCSGSLALGSWRVHVSASRREYLEALGLLFRQRVAETPPDDPALAGMHLLLLETSADANDLLGGSGLTDGDTAGWEVLGPECRTLCTGRFRLTVFTDTSPPRVVVLVREPQYSPRALRDQLFVIVSKILFSFDRFYVHAAAVELNGRVHVFVAPGSFGKSTICLRLARAGATILSEDHVVFRRAGDRFWVSGCQETARVTEKTERFLFDTPLDLEVQEHSGVRKKEFTVADLFSCAPFTDFPFDSLFFNHVGERFVIRDMSRRDAVLRLFYMTRGFLRINDPADLPRYLDYFSRLVEGRRCFDLELSHDLRDLDRLVTFLAE